MSPRVAVVTGSNKGIGFSIVKILCKQQPDWKVYVTARNEERGRTAVDELKKLGCTPGFCQLDIESKDSIDNAKSYFEKTYGGVDILVNNAGIAFKTTSTAPFSEQAEVTMRANFFGTLDVCDAFFPILKPGARVVIVASVVAQMALPKTSPSLRKIFTSESLTKEELVKYMNKFVSDAKNGVHEKEGWPSWSYAVTKIGALCLARVLQREYNKDARTDLVCNAVCPGWVRTDMAGPNAKLTPDEGAETPVYAATLPANTAIRGEFLKEKTVSEWK